MSKKLSVAVTLVLSIIIGASAARAAEIKLLTTGAFKPEVLARVPDFEKQTGHKVTVDNGTAGELKKRIEGGEVFDVAVITPDVVDDLIAKGTRRIDRRRIAIHSCRSAKPTRGECNISKAPPVRPT